MVLSCFGICGRRAKADNPSQPLLQSEKPNYSDRKNYDDNDRAADLVRTMRNNSQSTEELRKTLARELQETSSSLKQASLKQDFAKRVLILLERALRAEASMGPAMREAFDKSVESAKQIAELSEEFAKEHPIITGVVCVVVALGILYLLAPGIIEILGFTELGPAAGSFASGWQRLYGARVPVGSVFSYLQRLGMTWSGSWVAPVAPL